MAQKQATNEQGKSTIINFADLTIAEQDQYNACVLMLQSKIV